VTIHKIWSVLTYKLRDNLTTFVENYGMALDAVEVHTRHMTSYQPVDVRVTSSGVALSSRVSSVHCAGSHLGRRYIYLRRSATKPATPGHAGSAQLSAAGRALILTVAHTILVQRLAAAATNRRSN